MGCPRRSNVTLAHSCVLARKELIYHAAWCHLDWGHGLEFGAELLAHSLDILGPVTSISELPENSLYAYQIIDH